MSLDQGVEAVEQSVEPTPIGRVVEGEVATSRNGTAYEHADIQPRPVKIEDGDIGYHRKVIAQTSQAQGVLQSWMGHLAEKYQLPQGARIDEVGNILYPPPPGPPQG